MARRTKQHRKTAAASPPALAASVPRAEPLCAVCAAPVIARAYAWPSSHALRMIAFECSADPLHRQ
jgi:hypothetical protein